MRLNRPSVRPTVRPEHPMHLHGHRVYVIARGAPGVGPFDPTTCAVNTVNPILRDTITVNANSYIVLRFADSNPGVWFMHCHIDWHLMAGLAMTFIETPLPEESSTPTSFSSSSSSSAQALMSSANMLVWLIVLTVVFGIYVLVKMAFYVCRYRMEGITCTWHGMHRDGGNSGGGIDDYGIGNSNGNGDGRGSFQKASSVWFDSLHAPLLTTALTVNSPAVNSPVNSKNGDHLIYDHDQDHHTLSSDVDDMHMQEEQGARA